MLKEEHWSLKSDSQERGSLNHQKCWQKAASVPNVPPVFGHISEQLVYLSASHMHILLPWGHHWRMRLGCHFIFVGRNHYAVG